MSSLVPYDDALGLLQAANLGFPIAVANIAFDTPSDDATQTNTCWLAFDMIGSVLEPIELGGGAWQEEGYVHIQIVVPSGSGTRFARNVAKMVANVYRNLAPRNVVYFNANLGDDTLDAPDGNWYAIGVSIGYHWQDVPAPAPV